MISCFCFIAIRPPESADKALLVSAESALSAAFLLVAGSGRSSARREKGIAVLESNCWSVTALGPVDCFAALGTWALGGKRQRHRVCACDVMLCLDMVRPPRSQNCHIVRMGSEETNHSCAEGLLSHWNFSK